MPPILQCSHSCKPGACHVRGSRLVKPTLCAVASQGFTAACAVAVQSQVAYPQVC